MNKKTKRLLSFILAFILAFAMAITGLCFEPKNAEAKYMDDQGTDEHVVEEIKLPHYMTRSYLSLQ